MTNRPDTLARLDHWLARHRPHYHRALLPGATAADLDAAEKKIGRALPAELRHLLSWHNGQDQFGGAFMESWQLMSGSQIAAGKPDLDADRARTGWHPEWIPFLNDDQGNYLCLDASQPEHPVRAFWLGRVEHPVVAASLAQWLEAFVTAVEAGTYVEDKERGEFLRRSANS